MKIIIYDIILLVDKFLIDLLLIKITHINKIIILRFHIMWLIIRIKLLDLIDILWLIIDTLVVFVLSNKLLIIHSLALIMINQII